jgi:hypothetical protein
MSYSKGVMWLDDCRIPFVDEGEGKFLEKRSCIGGHQDIIVGGRPQTFYKYKQQQGRFTPNLLVCDDMLNDGSISKSGENNIRKSDGFNKNVYGIGIGIKQGDNNGEYGDKGSSSRYYDLDLWFDKMLEML